VNNLDRGYAALVSRVIRHGTQRKGRNGYTTASFGEMLRHDMRDSFPVLTTRKIHVNGIFAELAGFLEGATSLKRFKELGCNYWNFNASGDDLGPIYGAQWRDFHGVDQLKELTSGLKSDPYGRRHILTTWNPPEIPQMCLPPCHILNQYLVDSEGVMTSVVYMRSVDLCLGLPSDLVLYGLLHELVAKEVNQTAGELVFMLGDAHVYEQHLENWSIQSQRNAPLSDPRLAIEASNGLFDFLPEYVELQNYYPREAIKYELL